MEKNRQYGFTLLELIVVLAGLGILSSLAIPNALKYFDYARVDEAKALLNSAAADCLQKSRLNDKNKETIDESIISNQRLSSIGFKIDKANNADKCSYFQIIPTDPDDNIRFHQRILELSQVALLKEMADGLFLHMQAVRLRAMSEGDRIQRSVVDHAEIIEALEERDAGKAERRVREHTMRLHEHVRRTWSEMEQSRSGGDTPAVAS